MKTSWEHWKVLQEERWQCSTVGRVQSLKLEYMVSGELGSNFTSTPYHPDDPAQVNIAESPFHPFHRLL